MKMTDNSADTVRQQGKATAQAILDRAAMMNDMSERTARIIVEATESYARHIESFVAFCAQTEEQSRAITAQLEPFTGRPAPIDTDKMEREISQAPVARIPGRMPGAPR